MGASASVVGILTALRADMASGWMRSLAETVRAETLSDALNQAMDLCEKGYIARAAVVAGTASESHLRLLAMKSGVDIVLPSSAPKKADPLNADLVKAGSYATIQQKSVTAWLSIRNAAAHGDQEKFSESEVRHMMAAIRDFVARTPA
jgi:hypothetical protein